MCEELIGRKGKRRGNKYPKIVQQNGRHCKLDAKDSMHTMLAWLIQKNFTQKSIVKHTIVIIIYQRISQIQNLIFKGGVEG